MGDSSRLTVRRIARGSSTFVLAFAVAASAGLPTARAAAPPDGMTIHEQAIDAFERGDYDEAIELFERAYEQTGEPNHIFNIGRVYEEIGDLEKALERYEEFVHSTGVELDARRAASERITVIKEILGTETTPEVPAETVASPSAMQTQPETDDAGSAKPGKLGIAGYSLLGVSAAAFIAAGVTGGLTLARESRLTGDDPVDDPEGVQASGRRLAWATDGLLIAGGVFAIAGATMAIVDAVRRRRGPQVAARSVTPSLVAGRTGASLSLHGRF